MIKSDDTRCTSPSVWWVNLGSYGGSGWCVCDKHLPLVKEKAKVPGQPDLLVSITRLTSESNVLLTYAGERQNRKRCQWDDSIHGKPFKELDYQI